MMKKYTVVEYEQEDFDAVRDNMTTEKAIEILEGLIDGWFPYRLPKWGTKCNERDYDNYKICCAIWYAVEKLQEVGE